MTGIEQLSRLVNNELLYINNNDVEFEIRFGKFKGSNFTSGIDVNNFYRILSTFQYHTNNIYKQVSATSIVDKSYTIDNNVRLREETTNTENVFNYSTKQTLKNIDFINYFFRISISKENNIGTFDSIIQAGYPSAKYQSTRYKKRWSFELISNIIDHPLSPFRIDFTHVNGSYYNNNNVLIPVNNYEIELEVINRPISNFDQLWNGIIYMTELIQNTIYPITANKMSGIIKEFNTIFEKDIIAIDAKSDYKFNRYWRIVNVLNKPINLPLNVLKQGNKYAITDKADGTRKLLLFSETGVYLLYPPEETSQYLNIENNTEYYIKDTICNNLKGTVLDGEYLNINGVKTYLAFDILANKGKDIRNLSFTDRILTLKKLIDTYLKTNIYIKYKEYLFPPEPLDNRINTLLDIINITDPTHKKFKNYGNDGIIFNNISETYTNGTVYKWKPPEKLTIDFLFKDGKLYSKKDNGFVVFNAPYIFDQAPQNGQIIELAWNYTNKAFKLYRIRYDREQPNTITTAQNIFADIINPITESVLRGNSLDNARVYHNIIKKDLLKYAKSPLIDLGSGRGGDINKWFHYNLNVIAVEPNVNNLTDFEERLYNAGYYDKYSPHYSDSRDNDYWIKPNGNKILLLENGAEDYQSIQKALIKSFKQNTVKTITMFNVLTFFYSSEEYLDSLVKTINILLDKDGYYIGMYMDGSLIKDTLDKQGEIKGDEWIIKKVEFNTTPFNNRIYIDLGTTTIVKNQLEYLIDFDIFIKKLDEIGIKLIENKSIELDKFKGSTAQLNNLYKTFIFKRESKNNNLIEPIEDSITSNISKLSISNNDKFVVPKINRPKLLKSEEHNPFNYSNINFVKIGNNNNVSVLESILRAIDTDYIKEQNKADKIPLTNDDLIDRKNQLKKALNKYANSIKEKYTKLTKLKEQFPVWSQVIKIFNKAHLWEYFDMISILCELYNCNLIILHYNILTNDFTISKYNSSADKTVILYEYGGYYNTVGQYDGLNNLITVFDKNDIILNGLK
jgi:hypothetical protein